MATQHHDTTRQTLNLIAKVLRLEADKGYGDTSTTNGIAQFVGDRVEEMLASSDALPENALRELGQTTAGYRAASPAERASALTRALNLVEQLLDGPSKMIQSRPPTPRKRAGRATTGAPIKKATLPGGRVRSLSDSVEVLKGVGSQRAKLLANLGVRTIRDVLFLYPHRHIDYGNPTRIGSLLFGQMSTIQGMVESIDVATTARGRQIVELIVRDNTGYLKAVFFNQYIKNQLRPGDMVSLSGKIERFRSVLQMTSPEWERLDRETLSTGGLVPVYPLTKGLHQKTMRSLAREALTSALPLVQEFLPEQLLAGSDLIDIHSALEWVHFPSGETPQIAASRLEAARERLAFDEFLVLQLGLLQRKQLVQSQAGIAIPANPRTLERVRATLPFKLTGAQDLALGEILADMAMPRPMSRLLQGDVGSGKTIVAAMAGIVAMQAGLQVALMAPTELLAEQHLRSLTKVFERLPDDLRPTIALLTGSVGGAERTRIYAELASGELQMIVGTQALIQSTVEFVDLGLVIIDEQHRFGVEQRALLRSKGRTPDLLVMTATPIPRTLALTIHGELDVSTIDELPPGRLPITTYWANESKRAGAYGFVADQINAGRQAFIVFPLVEESEAIDARAAVAEHERLQQDVFPHFKLGLLHGRMRPAEKDAIMLDFRDGTIDILVSTSVVEVGIDVPNATVMMIDGAERFGLSQLHQFRGRVGRGSAQSHCILLTGDIGNEGQQRIQAMLDSQDGFVLAQRDLELRGPGDFIGTRQSGLPELKFAAIADVRDLERARRVAEQILASDPNLAEPGHARLRTRLEEFWASAVTDVS